MVSLLIVREMVELQEKEKNIRPKLLNVLCILTFIGSGLSLLSNSIMFVSIDYIIENIDLVQDYYENGMFKNIAADMDANIFDILLNINPMFFLLQSVMFAFAIYGAYLMWNLRKVGLHVYAISQLLLLIIPQVFLPELPFPFFDLVIALVFITLYAKNLSSLS